MPNCTLMYRVFFSVRRDRVATPVNTSPPAAFAGNRRQTADLDGRGICVMCFRKFSTVPEKTFDTTNAMGSLGSNSATGDAVQTGGLRESRGWMVNEGRELMQKRIDGQDEGYTIPITIHQMPGDLLTSRSEIARHLRNAMDLVTSNMAPSAPPTSDIEQLASDRQALQRRVTCAVLGVDGSSDVASATQSLELTTTEFKELSSRKAKLSVHNLGGMDGQMSWMQANMKYSTGLMSGLLNDHLTHLESQSVDVAPLKAALDQLRLAEHELEFTSSNPGHSSQSSSNALATGQPPGFSPFPGMSSGPIGAFQPGPAQPDEIILLVNPAQSASGGLTAAQSPQLAQDRQGQMSILMSHLSIVLHVRIKEVGMSGDQNAIRLLDAGTPQFLADKMTTPFLKVVSVDPNTRTITLSLSFR